MRTRHTFYVLVSLLTVRGLLLSPLTPAIPQVMAQSATAGAAVAR